MISFLRQASQTQPNDDYIALVNELWWRIGDAPEKKKMISFLAELFIIWPETDRMGLDHHLLSAVRTTS